MELTHADVADDVALTWHFTNPKSERHCTADVEMTHADVELTHADVELTCADVELTS